MSEPITLVYQSDALTIVTGYTKSTEWIDTWYDDFWFGADTWHGDVDLVKSGGTRIGNF